MKPRRGAKKVTQWHWSVTPMDQVGHAITCEEPQLSLVLLGEVKVELTVRNDAGEHHMRPREDQAVRRRWQRIAWSTPSPAAGSISRSSTGSGIRAQHLQHGADPRTRPPARGPHRRARRLEVVLRARRGARRGHRSPGPDAGTSPATRSSSLATNSSATISSPAVLCGPPTRPPAAAPTYGPPKRRRRPRAPAQLDHLRALALGALTTVKALEELVRTDEDALVSDANSTVGAFETKLQQPSEDEVHQRMAAGGAAGP